MIIEYFLPGVAAALLTPEPSEYPNCAGVNVRVVVCCVNCCWTVEPAIHEVKLQNIDVRVHTVIRYIRFNIQVIYYMEISSDELSRH